MKLETDDEADGKGIAIIKRASITRQQILMLSLGVLAGFSIGTFNESTVTVPVAGEVAGWVLGIIGLLVTGIIYQRQGKKCGCSSDCNGSCSI